MTSSCRANSAIPGQDSTPFRYATIHHRNPHSILLQKFGSITNAECLSGVNWEIRGYCSFASSLSHLKPIPPVPELHVPSLNETFLQLVSGGAEVFTLFSRIIFIYSCFPMRIHWSFIRVGSEHKKIPPEGILIEVETKTEIIGRVVLSPYPFRFTAATTIVKSQPNHHIANTHPGIVVRLEVW